MANPMIAMRSVTKTYAGREVLHQIDLRVGRGTIYGLLGVNGAGKTTAFKLLAGLLHPTSGEIVFNGQPISMRRRAFLYYFLIKSFNYPVSPRDAGNDLVGQRTNGIAQSLNHLFQSSKYLIMESSIPEFFPNLFNRIHFRRIWWDIKKDDIVGQI